MRKLYLVNEVGTTYYFDYRSNTLIEAIDGLGFSYDIEYQDFADSYVENKRTINQGIINMKLIFLDGYKGFTKWRDFVTKSSVLRLFYQSDGVKYCYINVKSSTKSQIESGIIRSSVVLECLTLWLVNKSALISVIQSSEGKTYAYTYPFVYAVSFNGKAIVKNDSVREVPLNIKITGNVLNPRVIIKQNGVALSGLRLLMDEREDPIIEISSEPTNQYMIKTINGEVIDIYQEQDFTYDNFLFLPPGTSEIFFDPGVREPCVCEITFREEYISN